MIQVFVVTTLKPGMRDAFVRAFLDNVPNVLREKGCLQYGPSLDAPGIDHPAQTKLGPDTCAVLEAWESWDALMAHVGAPHMKTFDDRVMPMVEDRKVYILSPAK
jgi:quinol monooxygenase YgiN